MRTLSKIQAVFFTLILMVSIPISANATDGQIKITQPVLPNTFPIIINKAGSYVLTSNLAVTDPDVNAITIEVNDVTLDLNGHKIQGPNTGAGNGYGIYASNRYSITVKNGRIWGFGRNGVFLSSATIGDPTEEGAGHIVENIQAMNNTWGGMRVSAGLILHCTANNNGFGGLSAPGIVAINATVSNCTANKNSGDGIITANSTVTQCTTNYNSSSGIESSTSIIRNCSAYNNASHGIYSFNESYITENNLRQNDGYGLILVWTNGNNFAIKNVASDNDLGNFYMESGNYMPTAGDNANYGF